MIDLSIIVASVNHMSFRLVGPKQQASGTRPELAPDVVSFLHSLDETDQPASKAIDFSRRRAHVVDDPELAGEIDLAVEFIHRPHSDLEESGELPARASSRTLGDVRTDGYRRRSHLSSESVALLSGKARGRLVDRFPQGDAVVPDVKSTKVPHLPSRTGLHSRLTPLRTPLSGSGLLPQACGMGQIGSKYPVPSTQYRLFIGQAR